MVKTGQNYKMMFFYSESSYKFLDNFKTLFIELVSSLVHDQK